MYYNENTIIYLDGKFLKADEGSANLYSQTLHYGLGVFEGIRSYHTKDGTTLFKGLEHYQRLNKSCELIGIPFNRDPQELCDITLELLRKNNFTDAYIRPLVFCPPNMTLGKPQSSNLLICAWEWSAYLGEKTLRVKVSPFCRPHPKSIAIASKACGHYVNSIMASSDAKQSGYDEALLLDHEGFLAEGPGANLFFEKSGKLFTPQKGNILAGITRQTIIELCEKFDLKVEEGKYTLEDLMSADAAFFCGTAAEVVGIHSINDFTFPLPWEKSKGSLLQKAYLKHVKREDQKLKQTLCQ